MKKNLKTAFLVLIVAIIALLGFVFYEYKTMKHYHILSFQDPKTQLFGFKDSDGITLIEPQYENSATDTLFAFAFVLKNNEWQAINSENEVVLKPFIVDNGPDYVSEGLFRFVENGKIGFADVDGNIVISAKYDFASPFQNGEAEYFIGGKMQAEGEHSTWVNAKEKGFINQKGKKIIK